MSRPVNDGNGLSDASADPETGRRDTGVQRRPALADKLVPVLIFAFCIAVAALTFTFDKAPEAFVGAGMQPRTFPLFLMVVIAGLNVVMLRETFRNPPERREPVEAITWITMALMAMFAIVSSLADMMLALAIVIFVKCMLWGERRIWVALALAILTPLTILLFFDLVLEVRFPRGWLTNLYYG